ncbi:MAG: hypothetical protein LKG27_05565 [Clostridiaceae bacterium]|nr:hypothetical protein [Clostridiaceae bacterium]
MEVSYYNLSGGINQALTKTELGSDTRSLYWTDAENVEIYKSRGIIQQKGNTLFLELPISESITSLKEMSKKESKSLVVTTISGKIYIYNPKTDKLTLLSKTITGTNIKFADFLDGLLVITDKDGLFYIKNNDNYDVVDCNLKDLEGNIVVDGIVAVYKGRVWVAKGSTIYYSALGTYDNFTLENDAGYIRDFYTHTDYITALKPYKDYLAIYKKHAIYLLSGTSQTDFSIKLLADTGTFSANSIVNVQNKQYFLTNGIYPLEEIGELNQIQLGTDISVNIKPEFDNFDVVRIENSICINYEKQHQIWYFIPYVGNDCYQTVWIYDYLNNAWYKRKIPQQITYSCIYDDCVLTSSKDGKIFKEDYGKTFDGLPIEFMWKSPFLSITSPHKRKVTDEFYFLIDDENDNNFKLSVYKDYDGLLSEDEEVIYSIQENQLYYASDDDTFDKLPCFWGKDNEGTPLWAINKEVLEKAEISGSNYSIQLCITGKDLTSACSVIGLQFREIYLDE